MHDYTLRMDIFSHADQADWLAGKASFDVLLKRYDCTISQLAVVLDVPHPDNIIAFRHAEDWWSVKFVEIIKEAREQYDAGNLEMATGRYGNHFFLYVFPRKKRGCRRYYFTLSGNGIEH